MTEPLSLATWNIKTLLQNLAVLDYSPVALGNIITLTMKEYGDLPVVLSLGDKQITAEVVLCPVSQVKDVAFADDAFMRLQKKMPLSSIAKTTISNEAHYVCFGALAATSLLENIVFEIVALAANALDLAELIETEL